MMKKLSGLILVTMLILSCEKKSVSLHNKLQIPKEDILVVKESHSVIQIDSVEVSDTIKISKNFSAEFSQKALVFEGLEKAVLDSLYFNHSFFGKKKINDYSKESVLKGITNAKEEYFREITSEKDQINPDFEQHWEEVSDMKVHSKNQNFLTINYNGYGFSGGAHGYAFDLYKVVDIQKQSIVQLSDIVDEAKIKWQPILLKHVDKEMLFDENITTNRNFFFDQNSITFIYNQYEIGPYVSGIIEIKVPFSEIKQALKPDFKKRLNIN